MGRLKNAFITRFMTLAIIPLALNFLSGCAGSEQTAPNPANLLSADSAPLIGSTPAILSAEFGQPALVRVDGTAQVWLYHTTSCGLNLILYPDASGIPRVTLASATDGSAAPETCAASLLQTHIDAAADAAAKAAAL